MADRDRQVGQAIADLRAEMPQQHLADRMREYGWKWSQATVWAVEKGERPLRFLEARDIAAILRVELEVLLGSVDAAKELRMRLAATEAEIDRLAPRLHVLRTEATDLRRRIHETERRQQQRALEDRYYGTKGED